MAGERNTNQPAVQGAERALDQFKYEIASELGVTLGGDRTSRENGSVGGEMTKRMIQLAERQLQGGTIPAGGGMGGGMTR
jgi:small acid-soluble spore protein B (major beta-type SASP)